MARLLNNPSLRSCQWIVHGSSRPSRPLASQGWGFKGRPFLDHPGLEVQLTEHQSIDKERGKKGARQYEAGAYRMDIAAGTDVGN